MIKPAPPDHPDYRLSLDEMWLQDDMRILPGTELKPRPLRSVERAVVETMIENLSLKNQLVLACRIIAILVVVASIATWIAVAQHLRDMTG